MCLQPWYYFRKTPVSETGMGLQIFTIPFQQLQLHSVNVLGWQLTQDQNYHYKDKFSYAVALRFKIHCVEYIISVRNYNLHIKFWFYGQGQDTSGKQKI